MDNKKEIIENSNNAEKSEAGLSLVDIWRIIVKNIIVIVIALVVGGVAGGGYAYGVKKDSYVSRGDMIVDAKEAINSGSTSAAEASNAVSLSIKIAASVSKLVKMEPITKQVAKEINLQYGTNLTYGSIARGLNASYETTSFFVSIDFTSKNKEIVQSVVESVIKNTIDYTNGEGAYVGMNDDLTWAKTVSSVSYYDENGAVDKTRPQASAAVTDAPNRKLITALGAVIGLVVGLIIAFIKELCSDKVTSKKLVEEKVDIKVIGILPDISGKEHSKKSSKASEGDNE